MLWSRFGREDRARVTDVLSVQLAKDAFLADRNINLVK
jgi:hypothetical protein